MRAAIRCSAVLTLFLTVGCRPSQVESHEQAFASLVSAERAFASTSLSSGTRTAFLQNFAADGIVFDAGPLNAHEVWEQRPEAGSVLSWAPEIANVSETGDMGFTSGPWELSATPDTEPVAWGHFISVWRRDATGSWRVAADGGIGHGPVTVNLAGPVVRFDGGTGEAPHPTGIDAAIIKTTLAELDDEYSMTVAESGFEAAIERFVGPSARFYRNGHLPMIGRDSISASAPVTGAVWTDWEQGAVNVSSSGDMGFTYGLAEFTPEQGTSDSPWNASYYRIWKLDSESNWRVVIDVLISFVSLGA